MNSGRIILPQLMSFLPEREFSKCVHRYRGLIGKGGLYGNVIRLTPPLTVERADIDHAMGILNDSFEKVSASRVV
jgi:4-aminobutyrate aminotransferase-like enzyme